MPTLNWIGKEAVVKHHKDVPYRLLEPVAELSCGDTSSGNLIVQGDNLHALKALLPRYAGQVKCIYIDPPYNTGNENWVYNDNVNSPEIRKWLGQVVGKEGETLDRHDRWLCMMYPRLVLLKRLLSPYGSIWISMDDSEIALLRGLMDEIFGHNRFVACNVWQKRYSRENREAIGDVHEYLLVYAMEPERFKETRNRVPLTETQAKIYKNLNDDPKGRWRGIPMTAQGWRPNQMYAITTPAGVVHRPPEGRCWSLIEPEFKKLLDEGRIYFGKNGKAQPSIIRYLDEVSGFVPWTWWPHEEVGHTDEARKEIQGLFDTQTAFDTPKPTRLLERLLQIATNPGDLILDSFAGSGTTGHAVLKLNNAVMDRQPRRFILVEMDQKIAREVTAERVRRAAEGYKRIKGEDVERLGGGFQFCKLSDEPLFMPDGQVRSDVTFAQLAEFVWFVETGSGFTPHPNPLPQGARAFSSPLLGVHEGRAVYLLYNGILKDRSAAGGNVLTWPVYESLPQFDGPKVIYAAACRLGASRLAREGITFKQTPYALDI
jgi:site-specific DNA-methyltransferase (adenine-specific)/adenine-specific DNA-methyltransferase